MTRHKVQNALAGVSFRATDRPAAAARRPSPAPRTPVRRAGWCRCCGPAGCPIRDASRKCRIDSISLAKLMVSPASTGLIQRKSRNPGEGPHTAIFSPRAAASWPALAIGHQQLHADRSDMPARRRQSAEQRFAPCFLVEMKALRIELRREFLDGLGGEGERSDFAPLPDLDVLEEIHQPPPAPPRPRDRRCTMIGETHSHNACPAALRTTALKVTMPVSGRLRETLASATSTSSVRSSPGRNGASQRNSLDAGRAQRGGAADIAVEHHPHHDRAQMPARAREALQHRARRPPPRRDASAADRIRRQTPASPRA